jgi:FlaA1/EpsC-like NDP-sugar epimerase
MGQGGEVFFLDMGEPVKILDLAHDLIRLAGLTPEDIEIKIVGPRPGEKLFEQLNGRDEQLQSSAHPRIRVTTNGHHSHSEVSRSIAALAPLVRESDDEIRRKLAEVLPEYAPSGTLEPVTR